MNFDSSADVPNHSRPILRDRFGVAAFSIYLAVSLIVFGRGLSGHLSTSAVGHGPDPAQAIWFIAWFAHALTHRLNLFLTRVIWVPSGVNIGWATNIALEAIVATPATLLWGPVATYNVLCLLAPALAGWATFLLCRQLESRWGASLLAGYIFGFSSYILCKQYANLTLSMMFLVPLGVYLVVRHVEGTIGKAWFVVLLAAVLAGQFLAFTEVLATSTLFGAIAIALALAFNERAARRRIWSTTCLVAVAYIAAAIVLTPYLYYLFAFGVPHGKILSPYLYSSDLLGFFIPSAVTELGTLPLLQQVASGFMPALNDAGAYISLPLFAVVALYARANWHRPEAKVLIHSLVIICVLAMGPWLRVDGHDVLVLPGMLISRLPLIGKALPNRFTVYAFLALAVIAALWFSRSRTRTGVKFATATAIIAFMLPNLSSAFWVANLNIPAFFSNGLYKKYLSPGETVVVLPYGMLGDGMLWQATTGMYFRQAGGFSGFSPLMPKAYERWPITSALFFVASVPDPAEQLKVFLANHEVRAIIVGDREFRILAEPGKQMRWTYLPMRDDRRRPIIDGLASLGIVPQKVGGVLLYRIPTSLLTPYLGLTSLQMERRANLRRFKALLLAGHQYLVNGNDTASLSPQRAQELHLLPDPSFARPIFADADPNPAFHVETILAATPNDDVKVGVEGWYDALTPIIEHYGSCASHIYFPYPKPLSASPPDGPAMLAMTFDREGLARAATDTGRPCDADSHPVAAPPAAAGR